MIIKIEKNQRLSDINKVFSSKFPFLKLEFFNSPHKTGEPTSKREMITENLQLSESGFTKDEMKIEIISGMTVNRLESIFRDQFGLYVQVFRKSGKIWLETSGTDNMTLEEQNNLGNEKTIPVEKTDITDIDYD